MGHIWRQDAIAANAREVQVLGRELADRLATMLGHLDKLGSALGSGVAAYNRTIASMESRVLVTGRRFTELQGLEDALESPRQIDVTPRIISGLAVAPVGVRAGSSDRDGPEERQRDDSPQTLHLRA